MIEKIKKEGKYLVMTLAGGKVAKYDLSSGATFGFKGGVVKGLQYQLGSVSVGRLLEHLSEVPTYVEFLKYVAQRTGARMHNRASLLFKELPRFAKYEQFFAMGLRFTAEYIPDNISIPKGCVRLLKEYDIQFSQSFLEFYTAHPNQTRDMLATAKECKQFTVQRWVTGLRQTSALGRDRINGFTYAHLLYFGYNPIALIKYLDRLLVDEEVETGSVLTEVFDYVNTVHQMADRWDRYPKWFLSTKHIADRNFSRFKEEYSEQLFAERVDTRFNMMIGDYVFSYPRTTADIKDEAGQQSHCVASYIDRVIDGTCDILFMRSRFDRTKSLVTIEWRKDHIEQAKGYQNRCPTEIEAEAIGMYTEKMIKRLSYPVVPDVDYDIVLDADVMDYDPNSFNMN
jgi:hypothetical protein